MEIRNIRLVSKNEVKVLLKSTQKWYRAEFEVRPNRGYEILFSKVSELGMNCKLGYLARVVVLESRENYAYCELQFFIPMELYLSEKRKHSKPKGNYIAGIDFNTDRINCVVIDWSGLIVDIKTFKFPAKPRGERAERRRTIIMQRLHEALEWMYNKGVRYIAVENPEALGLYKLNWIRRKEKGGNGNLNYKLSTFPCGILHDFPIHALEHAMKVIWVNPKDTSKLREEVGRKLGLDKHTGSAYIIALKGLLFLSKANKC